MGVLIAEIEKLGCVLWEEFAFTGEFLRQFLV